MAAAAMVGGGALGVGGKKGGSSVAGGAGAAASAKTKGLNISPGDFTISNPMAIASAKDRGGKEAAEAARTHALAFSSMRKGQNSSKKVGLGAAPGAKSKLVEEADDEDDEDDDEGEESDSGEESESEESADEDVKSKLKSKTVLIPVVVVKSDPKAVYNKNKLAAAKDEESSEESSEDDEDSDEEEESESEEEVPKKKALPGKVKK